MEIPAWFIWIATFFLAIGFLNTWIWIWRMQVRPKRPAKGRAYFGSGPFPMIWDGNRWLSSDWLVSMAEDKYRLFDELDGEIGAFVKTLTDVVEKDWQGGGVTGEAHRKAMTLLRKYGVIIGGTPKRMADDDDRH